MKSAGILGFFLLLAAFFALPTQQPAAENGAVIYFINTVKDFGKVPEDSTLTHIFVFFNRGSDTLRINKVKPG